MLSKSTKREVLDKTEPKKKLKIPLQDIALMRGRFTFNKLKFEANGLAIPEEDTPPIQMELEERGIIYQINPIKYSFRRRWRRCC